MPNGEPADVLFIGADEDDWNTVTLPRLEAAGADFNRVYEFYALEDTTMFNVDDHAAQLARMLEEHPFGLIVCEHLMDILPRMSNYNEPAAMRRALKPLRRVLAISGVGALAMLHVNKGQAQTFRQRSQGSVQYGAIARSQFLVDRHPTDPLRKVAVLAPVNYVRDDVSHALAFQVVSHPFAANGEVFDIGRAVDLEPDDVSMADVLQGDEKREKKPRPRDLVKAEIEAHIKGVHAQLSLKGSCALHPGFSIAELARAVSRDPKDGTVRNALVLMNMEGLVTRGEDKRWRPTDMLLDEEDA